MKAAQARHDGCSDRSGPAPSRKGSEPTNAPDEKKLDAIRRRIDESLSRARAGPAASLASLLRCPRRVGAGNVPREASARRGRRPRRRSRPSRRVVCARRPKVTAQPGCSGLAVPTAIGSESRSTGRRQRGARRQRRRDFTARLDLDHLASGGRATPNRARCVGGAGPGEVLAGRFRTASRGVEPGFRCVSPSAEIWVDRTSAGTRARLSIFAAIAATAARTSSSPSAT
jgi:hypothetical protein